MTDRDPLDALAGMADAEPKAEAAWPAPLAPDAFHGLPGRFVRTIEQHSEADPAALLLHFLAICGCIIGRDAGWRVGGALHTPTLYVVFVGDTAKGRKGTAAADVWRVVDLAEPGWRTEHAREGLTSGEGVIWHVRDPIRVRRKAKKGEAMKADQDGFIDEIVDPGIADKRLFISESEFAQALKVMAREGNTLSPTLRALWDNGTHGTLAKGQPARTTNAQLAITAHITTSELRRLMTESERANGFGNRFLFCCVRRAHILPFGGNLDEDALGFVAEQIRNAITAGRSVDGQIAMSGPAAKLWAGIYGELSEGRDGLLGAITARAESQVIRLAVTYSLLDPAARDIELEHLRAALAVWRYCEDSAAHVFGARLGNIEADRILDALRMAGDDGLTRTEIRDLFSHSTKAARIDGALAFLRRRLLARSERVETGGRPGERWIVMGKREAGPKADIQDQTPQSQALVPDTRLSSRAADVEERLRRSLGVDNERERP